MDKIKFLLLVVRTKTKFYSVVGRPTKMFVQYLYRWWIAELQLIPISFLVYNTRNT